MARAAKVYACALVSRGGRVLLVQEPQGQAVRWRFPTAPVPEGEDAGVALFRFLARDLALTPLGLEFVCTYPVMSGPMRERGLYHVFEVTGFRRQRASPAAPARWLTLAEIGQEDTSPVVAAVVGAATARRPRTRGPAGYNGRDCATKGGTMLLKDKAAIITGGGSGIGRSAALLLAEEGARVCVADFNAAGAEETVKLVKAKGREAIATVTDVRQEAQVKAMVEACVRAFGRVDVLVANAGISGPGKYTPAHELPLETWQLVIDTHLTGVFLSAKHALGVMVQQKSGAIVNMASVSGLVGMSTNHPYTSAKHGIVGLTKNLALQYAQHGIRVNCIAPGSIDTPLSRGSLAPQERGLPIEQRGTIQRTPMRRIGTPEEVAQAVLYLASQRSSFVTGACLVVDGGYTAQ